MVSAQEFVNQLKNKAKKLSFNITHEELAGKLDLTEFTKLKWLNCSENELTNLDLSQNNDLETINATKNKLKNLDWLADLPQKDKLKSLSLFGNDIEEIDFAELFTNFPKLEKINLSGNPLKAKNLDNLSSEQFAKLVNGIKEKKIRINSYKGTVLMDLLEYAQKLASQGNTHANAYLQTLQSNSSAKTDNKQPGNNTPLLIGGLVVFGLVAVAVGYLLGKRRKTD